MNRKDILSISFIIIFTLVMMAVVVAAMPLWLPVILINPHIINPFQEQLTHQIMKRAVRSMVRL